FVAAQRTEHGIPHALSCRALDLTESWFYKCRDRAPTPREERRAELDAAVRASFDDSGASRGPTGRPGCSRTSSRPVGGCQRRQWRPRWPARAWSGAAPSASGARSLAPTKRPPPSPTWSSGTSAPRRVDQKWCGDLTEIPTEEGKLYLATIEDLASRRMAGFAIGEHHDAALAKAALCMAAATRGGTVAGVIFHTDKGGEYTGDVFASVCEALAVTQSMGRVGSALDNAAAESFNSTLEWELLSRRHFATKDQARQEVAAYIDRYNHRRRHSSCEM